MNSGLIENDEGTTGQLQLRQTEQLVVQDTYDRWGKIGIRENHTGFRVSCDM